MKISEAPPRGWYPDPEGGVRLRWWDGEDWSDRYRSRPSIQTGHEFVTGGVHLYQPGELRRQSNDQLITEVRQAARAEIERAADLFSARARAATRQIEPLISQYTSRFLRLFKIVLTVVVILVVAWIFFQVVAQVSFFDWLGDRIDNLRDDSSGLPTRVT